MVLPVLAAFAKAAAPYVLPAVAGAINQRNQNEAAMDAYNKQRAAEKEDQANKFTDMAAAARRAGFNPLTVLRATGGAGYGGTNAVMPVMSKQNFAATFAANAVGQYFNDVKNAPIDKYNEEIRQLEKQQRQLDIKLSRKQLSEIKKPQKQKTYLYNDDGTPMLNAYGQQMYVDEAAAAVFPTLQAYMTPGGETLSLPHEQLLDMSATSLPTATGAIAGGIAAAKQKNFPTTFRYPSLSMSGQRFTYGTFEDGTIPHTLQ